MKLAILLLCHKNAEQINLFLETMKNDDIEFFIHIDKKSNISREILQRDDIHILEDSLRVDVRWGEISQLKATLNLLEVARETNRFDTFWLCSGQDFPLVSSDCMIHFFMNHREMNFISFWDSYHVCNKENHLDKRNAMYYPHFLMGRTTFKRLLKRTYIEISGGYNHTYGLFRRKDRFSTIKFYFGPSWVALNKTFAQWIFDYLANNPWVMLGYEQSLNPDESFFQTLLMLSPYKDTQHEYLHYIDWSERPGKPRNSPNTLTVADYEKMKSSCFLMARKFDMDVDKKIIYKLRECNREDKIKHFKP